MGSEVKSGWRSSLLGTVTSLVTSGSRGWSKYYAPDGPVFFRSQNVKDGFLDLNDRVHVRPPDNGEGTRTALRCGDILVSVTGEVGNAAVVKPHHLPAYVSQHVGLIRLNDPSFAVSLR